MSVLPATATTDQPCRASAAARALALIAGLFALSLDLILGLAGIVSLGHAAFLGLGAYAAAILASNGFADPFFGLASGAGVAALVGLVTAPLLLRGGDLTRLMVTLGVSLMLGELANRNGWLTGGGRKSSSGLPC
jgi:branched-chain amino acid transport system permease protein